MKQTEFLHIVMPFKDKVFRLAKRLLVSKDEAEDATQEVILKLWQNKEAIKKYKNVEAFAMTMTKNFCFDKLKSKQAQNLKIVHSNYKDETISLQRKLEVNDALERVKKLIEALPEQQKLVIQLRDIEQYEFNEIEEMLEMKAGTIRVLLSRARKTIRQQLIQAHNYGIK
ncbi:RNA polymerase sigma factor [Aurantibacter aestuarii]|uniref:RNA polymerase subunit sigma-70 n=1 Tax=Aurantibacter aestuarii TaxID=1266046 RepID=A0A2T1N5F6_9FLAO|nr:RNA polymerase sigma factor [Aurantibacter aestuarii]PSG86495.1 RNA polymerase subunit sigma-70 [Aurantibacter aestuarii]